MLGLINYYLLAITFVIYLVAKKGGIPHFFSVLADHIGNTGLRILASSFSILIFRSI